MFDEQLLRLTEVLKKGRIWALNAGENFEISLQAWESFTKELQHTAVAYLYVSEHHLARTDLKKRMQDAIRENRRWAISNHPSMTHSSVLVAVLLIAAPMLWFVSCLSDYCICSARLKRLR